MRQDGGTPQMRRPAWQRAPEITHQTDDAMLSHRTTAGNQTVKPPGTELDLKRAARRLQLFYFAIETRTGTRYLLAPRRGRPDPASVRQFDSLAAALSACRAARPERGRQRSNNGHEY